MNHSIHSADRMTHLKIVAVALVGAVLVSGIGIAARMSGDSTPRVEAQVIKAGAPVAISSSGTRTIR